MTPNESEIEDIIRCSREPLGEGDPSMVLHSENRLRAILIAHHQVEAAAHARGREEGLEEAAKVAEKELRCLIVWRDTTWNRACWKIAAAIRALNPKER